MSRVLEQPLEPAPPRADVSAEGPGARQRVVAKRRRRPSGEPPPLPRNLRSTGKYWLGLSGVVLIGWMVTLASDPIKEALTRADIEVLQALGSMRNGFFTSLAKAFHALGSEWTIALLRWGAIIVLLAFKRFRHLFVFLGATLAVGWVTTTVAHAALRARPLEIDIIGSWEGSAHPSRPVAALAVSLVAIVYSLVVPGSPRMWAKWIAGFFIVALCGARLYLGVDHPSDVIVGGILGVALPLVAFRSLAPNEVFPVSYRRKRAAHLDVDGPRGDAIRLAVEEQLGVSITDVRPVGLAGSGGSTPLRLLVSGEPPQELFAKLYAHTHLRADRWYKVGRALLYGRLEDEASFSTVRRLVQYEDYMLRFMRDAGLPTPTPFGFVEITPEREYLLVTDFVPRAKELLEAEVDDHIIDECLALSRALWDAGVAHRDIKPSNLLVSEGHVHLIDVAFGEIRPSPWRQAVDLANMMIVLALRSDCDRVYERSLRYFTPDEVAEAFAATHSVTVPSQSRSLLKRSGGKDDKRRWMPFKRSRTEDVVERFRKLAPKRRPISIQRWSVRRAGLTISVLLGGLVIAFSAFANFEGAGLLSPRDASLAAFSTVTKPPDCKSVSNQTVLVAQSIPSAPLLPCIEALPVGWHFQGLDVKNGFMHMFLDSDRAGFRAVEVALASSCSIDGSTEVPTDEPGTRRFEKVDLRSDEYSGSRYYVFPGGCVTYTFDFTGTARTSLIEEATSALGFVTRDEVAAELEKKTGLEL